jgi:hypothetical protein
MQRARHLPPNEQRTDLLLQSYLNLNSNDNLLSSFPISAKPRWWDKECGLVGSSLVLSPLLRVRDEGQPLPRSIGGRSTS